jgi:magnesium chelatase subunit D
LGQQRRDSTSSPQTCVRRYATPQAGVWSDAYRRRDRAALIAFGGSGACLVVPPTNSVSLADRRLLELPTGGRTPLAAALELAAATLDRSERRQRGAGGGHTPLLILISDGKANMPATPVGDPWHETLRAAERLRRRGTPALVLDPTPAGFGLGLTRALAAALGAPLWPLAD